MPFTNTKFARSSLLMLMVGAAVLAAIVVSSVYLARSTQSYFADVVRLRDLRSSSADMMLLLRAAEAGQRGFLLSRDQEFLEPYLAATERVAASRSRFQKAYDGQTAVHFPVEQFNELLDAKLAEMKRTLDLAEADRFDEAITLVREATGREIMDSISSLLITLIRDLDERLSTGIQELNGTLARCNGRQWAAALSS